MFTLNINYLSCEAVHICYILEGELWEYVSKETKWYLDGKSPRFCNLLLGLLVVMKETSVNQHTQLWHQYNQGRKGEINQDCLKPYADVFIRMGGGTNGNQNDADDKRVELEKLELVVVSYLACISLG